METDIIWRKRENDHSVDFGILEICCIMILFPWYGLPLEILLRVMHNQNKKAASSASHRKLIISNCYLATTVKSQKA